MSYVGDTHMQSMRRQVIQEPGVPTWLALKNAGWTKAEDILTWCNAIVPPIDVDRIARDLHIHILRAPADGWSGAVESSEERAVIFVDKNDSLPRQRFTIAHELGHLLQHPVGVFHRDQSGTPYTAEERQANAFAAALLMPFGVMEPFVEKYGPDAKTLADIFQVSERAMNVRLKAFLGLQDERYG